MNLLYHFSKFAQLMLIMDTPIIARAIIANKKTHADDDDDDDFTKQIKGEKTVDQKFC